MERLERGRILSKPSPGGRMETRSREDPTRQTYRESMRYSKQLIFDCALKNMSEDTLFEMAH